MRDNLILATDSYKLGHWRQYPKNTTGVYSYFESRTGAAFPYTVFFGLQSILYQIADRAVEPEDLDKAVALSEAHFGNPDIFNLAGWWHILDEHYGRLPLLIKAVPEGTVVPTGNVLMTVENTDPKAFWLTNAMESLLTHVWYPSTVATLSRRTKELLASFLDRTADSRAGLEFMLHDFGYRGATTHESAAIGGAGHLVNFLGTDTLPAMELAMRDYYADLESLAFSVPATEHSVMTALGEAGEMDVVRQLLAEHPTGILSIVADSYNIYEFVNAIGTTFKEDVLARDGVVVVRPDSTTLRHNLPCTLMTWIAEALWASFGGTTNSKGFRVLDPHVRVIWGDGIDQAGINKILGRTTLAGFSAENFVFGMGGGLLQKVNRDTQRFAFKSSAQQRRGTWHDVYKKPLDQSKASKRGRLALVEQDGVLTTVRQDYRSAGQDQLQVVFSNGRLYNETTFAEVRERAALPSPVADQAAASPSYQ